MNEYVNILYIPLSIAWLNGLMDIAKKDIHSRRGRRRRRRREQEKNAMNYSWSKQIVEHVKQTHVAHDISMQRAMKLWTWTLNNEHVHTNTQANGLLTGWEIHANLRLNQITLNANTKQQQNHEKKCGNGKWNKMCCAEVSNWSIDSTQLWCLLIEYRQNSRLAIS